MNALAMHFDDMDMDPLKMDSLMVECGVESASPVGRGGGMMKLMQEQDAAHGEWSGLSMGSGAHAAPDVGGIGGIMSLVGRDSASAASERPAREGAGAVCKPCRDNVHVCDQGSASGSSSSTRDFFGTVPAHAQRDTCPSPEDLVDEATDRVSPLYRKQWRGAPPTRFGQVLFDDIEEDVGVEGTAAHPAERSAHKSERTIGTYRRAVAKSLRKGNTVMM
mmetsp:Transcript_4645/g.9176  ORF Transcript_4645/g.9176 Transcript_4645/m.9176 type:complete len:220 (-) Transcript_4645:164-823(-)|eukprot:CAMPEP_0173387276 /NCGR_PEP_ID=MMETSP1356-20130122/9789_1 /TAXON_ID=77927 ORGANISM="Hemiselmis virescens, Strain PCC157" /NCGR_SAMPLE_ID=MMETSP1356 /ASSEMBLY_ACC=CAM_ASM_000847 /LENGTH=219 /DNA_ID=CAMNT_0014343815 /DNA_START=81 /DNA_END=740 /DNA_ORIENTATION=+